MIRGYSVNDWKNLSEGAGFLHPMVKLGGITNAR